MNKIVSYYQHKTWAQCIGIYEAINSKCVYIYIYIKCGITVMLLEYMIKEHITRQCTDALHVLLFIYIYIHTHTHTHEVCSNSIRTDHSTWSRWSLRGFNPNCLQHSSLPQLLTLPNIAATVGNILRSPVSGCLIVASSNFVWCPPLPQIGALLELS